MATEMTRAILVRDNVDLIARGYDIEAAYGSTDPTCTRVLVMGTAAQLAALVAEDLDAAWAPAGWYEDDTEGGVLVGADGGATALPRRPDERLAPSDYTSDPATPDAQARALGYRDDADFAADLADRDDLEDAASPADRRASMEE